MHARPSTVVEAEELIVQVQACKHENADLPAVVCSCEDILAELYAIKAALIPEPQP